MFIKGFTPWNKGKKGLQIGWNKGRKFPQFSEENSIHWKGDNITYETIHWWLKKNYGKATNCEQCGSTKNVQWAKLKGKEYERKRENFWMLCAKCHIIYDNTGRAGWNKGLKGIYHIWPNGRTFSEETKKKMSLARLGKPPWNKGRKMKELIKA